MIKVKIVKPHLKASDLNFIPRTVGSAAIDLRVFLPNDMTEEEYDRVEWTDGVGTVYLEPGEQFRFHTGIAVEIPSDTAILLLPRSGLGNEGLHMANQTGLVDSDYRGELKVTLVNNSKTRKRFTITEGDRVIQLLHIPIIPPRIMLVDELSETGRGKGGFGHTGTK